MMGRARITAVVTVALVGISGCAGSSAPAAAPVASTTSVSSEASVEPTETTQTTETTDAPTSPSATTVTASATSPSATSGPVPSPGPTRWPKALGEPAQGDPVWAVYLALAHSGTDPALDTALQQAAAAGYSGVQGDLACDQGAIEALGLDQFDYWSAVTLYFATERDASDFVASYTAEVAKVVGSTRVNVGCLD